MKSFVTATAAFSLACLLGCGKSDSTSASKSSEAKSTNGATVAKSQSIPVKPKKPPLDQRLYGEHRLAAWPRVIKNLDPNGPDGQPP